MTAVLAALVATPLGLLVGVLVNRAAGRFPWPATVRVAELVRRGPVAVPPPVVEVLTGVLFALVAVRFGVAPELPAFLFLAGVGVLLAVIDLQHRLLPNRVVLPSIGIGAVLLLVAALAGAAWPDLLRAGLGAAVLFTAYLVLALISPSGLGMGDVKLAGLLGLYLGWLGWGVVLVGAVGGFVVQAVLALALLAGGRVGLKGELPFGPAMLVGAALAIGWAGSAL